MLISQKKYAVIFLITLFMFAVPRTSYSQISITTENMALGGGGTAYITGYEALFLNPANLYIQEKSYRTQFSLFQAAVYYDTVLPYSNNGNRVRSFRDQTKFFDNQSDLKSLETADYETILNRNYPINKASSEFLTESDFYWFGVKWMKPERSYAVSFRTRYANRYELGRGFFSDVPVEKNNHQMLDYSFSQKTQVFHELSFGYAESFTFLNGLLPQLSEFIIGIAPKIVFSGASLDADFDNRYRRDDETARWNHNAAYAQQSSGVLTPYGTQFFANGNLPNQANDSFRNLMKPTGIGGGIDVGVTYLLTFGNDLSVFRQENQPTQKSLRLSLSVTDLGLVYQFKSPFQYISESVDNLTPQSGSQSEYTFTGAPNEHYLFLSQFDEFTNLNPGSENEESFALLLPTSIQAGALFQFQRVKLTGDFSYSLSDSPFNHSGLASSIGVEVRPLPYIPLRAGTRFAPNMAGYYSFGTGLETNRFDLNMSLLVKSKEAGPTSEILGVSILAMKIYIP